MDFFTTEVWTPHGLKTYYVLFAMDLKRRRVHVAGVTPNPSELFMAQVARNLTDTFDGFLKGHRFLICDRDSKFSEQFRQILRGAGVDAIRTPIQAPNWSRFEPPTMMPLDPELSRPSFRIGRAGQLHRSAEFLVRCGPGCNAILVADPSPRPRFLPAAPTDDVLRRKLWLLTQQLLRHGINHHDQHHNRRHPKRHADPGRRPDRGRQVNVTQVDRREADHWQ